MRKPRFIAGAVALLFLAAFAYGKVAEGVLDGVVLNGRGAPVAFAQIFWQAADGKAPHAIRTNGKGRAGAFRQSWHRDAALDSSQIVK